jgi:hypothetical protein
MIPDLRMICKEIVAIAIAIYGDEIKLMIKLMNDR